MMTNQVSDRVVEQARERLRAFMARRADLSAPDIAAHCMLSEFTVKGFINGNCRGGREVVSEITRVLDLAEAGEILRPGGGGLFVLAEDPAERTRRVRHIQNFYETQTVRKVAEVLNYCAENAAIGVVTADFGVGKTEAVKAWRLGRGRKVETLAFEFDEFSSCNKVDFVRQLAEMLGLDAPKGSWNGAFVFRSVCQALRDRPCLLVFDQCEVVRVRIFQIIRQLWDRTHDAGVGVVLLAAPVLMNRMLGSRMADLGALTSRVGIWAPLSGITKAEMAAIVRQEGSGDVEDSAFEAWYRATGGSMRRLMRSLDLLKSKHAGKRITERTIAGVAGSLWGMNFVAGRPAACTEGGTAADAAAA